MSTSRFSWRRVITFASTAGMILALVVAGLMLLPALFGFERYVIMSGSMEPAIPTGSIVYDEVVPVADLEVGDVITFVPPPEFHIEEPVTHRIVDSEHVSGPDGTGRYQAFRTKGDANEDIDPWQVVLDSDKQARVKFHIEYIGWVYLFLSLRWVQILLIGLPAVGITIFVGISLWRVSGDAVLEEQAESADEEREEVPS